MFMNAITTSKVWLLPSIRRSNLKHGEFTTLEEFLETMFQSCLSSDDGLHSLLEHEYAAFIGKENLLIEDGAISQDTHNSIGETIDGSFWGEGSLTIKAIEAKGINRAIVSGSD